MKTDVTYGFVSGALFVYSDAIAENKHEKTVLKEYIKALNGTLENKLKGDRKYDDDDCLLGVNFDEKISNNIKTIISRVVKTICMDFEVDFKLRIHKVQK